MPTQTQATVNDILQIISDLRAESATNTDASRIRAVSRAERDFARRRFWRIHLLKDQSLGTGDGTTTTFTVGSASYPMRAKGIFEVFVGGTTEDKRRQIVDFTKAKTLINNNASQAFAYEWYDAANDVWKVTVNPAPASGAAVTASYFWEPPTRTATNDPVICHNPEILARLALGEIYESEDEPDKRDENLQLAEQMIDEVAGTETAPAINQLYTMGPIESSIRNRGIGSY